MNALFFLVNPLIFVLTLSYIYTLASRHNYVLLPIKQQARYRFCLLLFATVSKNHWIEWRIATVEETVISIQLLAVLMCFP